MILGVFIVVIMPCQKLSANQNGKSVDINLNQITASKVEIISEIGRAKQTHGLS
jgi:hypothetical protein